MILDQIHIILWLSIRSSIFVGDHTAKTMIKLLIYCFHWFSMIQTELLFDGKLIFGFIDHGYQATIIWWTNVCFLLYQWTDLDL
jgi:hypothetical protein